MSIVTITLNNRDFKLVCPESNHSELFSLVDKLDLELSRIKQSNPSASFELLLIMLSLKLIDDNQKVKTLNAGEVLQDAQNDFQMILSSIFDELKLVAKNLE